MQRSCSDMYDNMLYVILQFLVAKFLGLTLRIISLLLRAVSSYNGGLRLTHVKFENYSSNPRGTCHHFSFTCLPFCRNCMTRTGNHALCLHLNYLPYRTCDFYTWLLCLTLPQYLFLFMNLE